MDDVPNTFIGQTTTEFPPESAAVRQNGTFKSGQIPGSGSFTTNTDACEDTLIESNPLSTMPKPGLPSTTAAGRATTQ
jgi:hypothetical protein